ncbi:histidine-containing phosphotransfer protein 1-like [Triticum dicoccoides]|uniref:histidine-containing phosphotransfer protein 1-like n=1 Tax=Triticum dicoccoides TaxID=85692 RepID=UPI000E78A638|nr:histidine-containing phosphotransfer protein 1-like [Triticum dicoccoides]
MREQGRVTPAHVVEVMNHFLNEAERIIKDITGPMNKPEVDFDKVDGLVQQLKVACSSVGAKRLNLCCVQHFSPEAKTKEGYLAALGHVRFQFCDLRSMFKIIMELEQHFAACGPK